MASFPIFKHLSIRNYGLYPGQTGNGLSFSFESGLTLILGANGLGKTTLISLLFRQLTGPFDIALPSGSIGTAELKAFPMGPFSRGAFAARVNDGAKNGVATLTFELGATLFTVTRSLQDLTLKSLQIDGEDLAPDEIDFQRRVLYEASLANFGEWILVLRTLVFFFEDRRSLVWDPSAQRQLLRCLLLPAQQAVDWTTAEREILEEDTRMRNLQSALRREQRETTKVQRKIGTEAGVVAALKAAEQTAVRLKEQQEKLTDRLQELDKLRHRTRLDHLRAQAEHDSAIQELERARLLAVESRFPSADASMRYIFSHLMADDECLVCRTQGLEEKRVQLALAIEKHHCVVCNSPVKSDSTTIELSGERINLMMERSSTTREAALACKSAFEAATLSYSTTSNELGNCIATLSEAESQINALTKQLPPAEQAIRRQREELNTLEGRVVALRSSIKTKREAFNLTMSNHRETIRNSAESIKAAFESAARGFLLEESSLSWSPSRVQVGQAGAEGVDPVEYPAFAVELSGADFSTIVRRDGPQQVSESQREFIDLAFRMALIYVAADNETGSIVIDAPESSLDAVFVDRAATVLARFSKSNSKNRLVVTSNLAAGTLIPRLVEACESNPKQRQKRIVDLFLEGVPTRAMKELSEEYSALRSKLYQELSIS